MTAGIYELGSTMKSVTIAGALDSGKVKITDSFDARFGVRFGRFTITDFHGKNRILTLPEVYKYSSNVGAIHVMQQWGKDNFRAFLHKMQFDVPEPLELPERRNPVVPKTFSDIVAATAALRPRPVGVADCHAARHGAPSPMTAYGQADALQDLPRGRRKDLRAGRLAADQRRDALHHAA